MTLAKGSTDSSSYFGGQSFFVVFGQARFGTHGKARVKECRGEELDPGDKFNFSGCVSDNNYGIFKKKCA